MKPKDEIQQANDRTRNLERGGYWNYTQVNAYNRESRNPFQMHKTSVKILKETKRKTLQLNPVNPSLIQDI